MGKLSKAAVVVGLMGASIALAASAIAAKPTGDTRPGWGFGDQNHVHTGPPGGPSVHPVK